MTTTCYFCALISFHLINDTYKFTQLNVNGMFFYELCKEKYKEREREKNT